MHFVDTPARQNFKQKECNFQVKILESNVIKNEFCAYFAVGYRGKLAQKVYQNPSKYEELKMSSKMH